MQDKIVAVKKEGAVAWVTMNRPGSLNSLTAELCAALKQVLSECEADDDVRVVVLAGEGKAFCAGGDLRMLHAASFFQFTYLGSPIIYYGDELGMEGGDDPFCRFPMRWDAVEGNPTHAHYQKLARIRRQTSALRVGSFRTHAAMENGLYAYVREAGGQQVLCVVNTGLEPVKTRLALPTGLSGLAAVHDLYADRSLPVEDGAVCVRLDVGEGLILA